MTRDQALQQIADNVTALTRQTISAAEYVRSGGRGEDGVRRPTHEAGVHRVTQRGLLLQLVAALWHGSRPDAGSEGTRSKPGSKVPSAPSASNALDDIENGWGVGDDDWRAGVYNQQARMRRAAGRPLTQRRPGAHLARRRSRLVSALADIRRLAHTLPDPWPEEAAAATAAWVGRARRAFDAPVREFQDLLCPECRTRLKVPEDLSGDVFCPNHACRDEEGRRRVWAQDQWGLLLERIASEGAA